MNTRTITFNAIIAAIYVVVSLLMHPLSYGEIQLRISEMLMLLAFYNKKFIPGLVLGCVITNFFSDLGVLDWTLGNLSTVIVCVVYAISNNKYISTVINSIIIGVIVGFELFLMYDLPYFMTVLTVSIGELLSLLLGCVVFHYAIKNENFKKMIIS